MNLTSQEWQAIGLSVQVAVVAVLISLPLAIVGGWVLARYQFWGKTLLDTVIYLPLVLPPVVTGYLLLLLVGRQGWIGGPLDHWLGWRFIFDWKGAVLAAAVVSFPLLVRAIRSAFADIDLAYEQQARTLGAGRFDCFFTISLPLASRGIIAGCVLAFARSLGEFGATIMIAGNVRGQTQTMSLYVFEQLQSPGDSSRVSVIVLISVLLSAAALYGSQRLERRYEPMSRGSHG